MSKPTYEIKFPEQRGADDPPGYHHRVKNFAEDLQRIIEPAKIGTVITDIDMYFDALQIDLAKNKYSSRVNEAITRLAKQHHFESEINIHTY